MKAKPHGRREQTMPAPCSLGELAAATGLMPHSAKTGGLGRVPPASSEAAGDPGGDEPGLAAYPREDP